MSTANPVTYLPNIIYIIASIPSFPLNIAIMSIIIWKRRYNEKYRTTFYNIVISLGLADTLAMLQTGLIQVPRVMYIFTEFYWSNRGWIASLSYNISLFSVGLRCFGATLLAFQRYIIVCWGSHYRYKFLLNLPLSVVLLIHWIPPNIVALPVTLNWNKTFGGPNDMRLVLSIDQSNFSLMLQGVTVAVLFCSCIFPYSQIFRTLWDIKKTHNKNIGRELRLSIIPLGQSFCFLGMVFSYTTIYVLNITQNPLVDVFKQYTVLFNGILSYWNPWIYLFLNTDIQNEFRFLFFKIYPNHSSVSQIRNISNQPSRIFPSQTLH